MITVFSRITKAMSGLGADPLEGRDEWWSPRRRKCYPAADQVVGGPDAVERDRHSPRAARAMLSIRDWSRQ